MGYFRKKPVVIEARQFHDINDYIGIAGWMKEYGQTSRYSTPNMFIDTLEGKHKATSGDWIIKGVKDEFYPCKPEIFAATYDAVEPTNAD